MSDRKIGTCSLCGGAVTVPDIWLGINPPTPTCSSCGAVPIEAHGPVLPMQPRRSNKLANLFAVWTAAGLGVHITSSEGL